MNVCNGHSAASKFPVLYNHAMVNFCMQWKYLDLAWEIFEVKHNIVVTVQMEKLFCNCDGLKMEYIIEYE